MPLTRKGVTFTTAYLEAAAIAHVGTAMLSAFELNNEDLPDGPLRFVNDTAPLLATLEADAPFDPSTQVEFLACPGRIKPPEESDAASAPEIVYEVDNISGAVSDALTLTRGSLKPWTLIERIYASDDTSGPAQLPPRKVELKSVSITSTTASLTFAFGDPGNVRIPGLTFNRTDYPTLTR